MRWRRSPAPQKMLRQLAVFETLVRRCNTSQALLQQDAGWDDPKRNTGDLHREVCMPNTDPCSCNANLEAWQVSTCMRKPANHNGLAFISLKTGIPALTRTAFPLSTSRA